MNCRASTFRGADEGEGQVVVSGERPQPQQGPAGASSRNSPAPSQVLWLLTASRQLADVHMVMSTDIVKVLG